MGGGQDDRQYLLAREADLWLAESQRVEELFKRGKADEDRDVAWLGHIVARRNALNEEIAEASRAQRAQWTPAVVPVGDSDGAH